MKILLVDNKSKYKSKILNALSPHKITIQPYQEIKKGYNKFDVIILSGGHSYSVKNHSEKYAKEIELIKKSKIPILGICLGFELIAFAFDENLVRLKKEEKTTKTIKLKPNKLTQKLKQLKVLENHHWALKETKSLKPLAKSKTGIEIIKHPKREIYGVQFHPEAIPQDTKIITNFLKLAQTQKL